MEDNPIVISDEEDNAGSAIIAANSPHNSMNSMQTSSTSHPPRNSAAPIDMTIGGDHGTVPEAGGIETKISRTAYAREESVVLSTSSNYGPGMELLRPRQSGIINIDLEDEQLRQLVLESVSAATTPGAQSNEPICLNDSPPNKSMSTTPDEQYTSNVLTNMLKQVDKKKCSVPMRKKRNSNISLVGYTEDSIVPQPPTNDDLGNFSLIIGEQATSHNAQRNTETSPHPEGDTIQILNAHARATIAAQTSSDNSSTESSIAHHQLTTNNHSTVESIPMIAESPSVEHVHVHKQSYTDQPSDSKSVGGTTQGIRCDRESTQLTGSQEQWITVNAVRLDEVVKFTASCYEMFYPDSGTAQEHMTRLYQQLMTKASPREPTLSMLGATSSTCEQSSANENGSSRRTNAVMDDDVICVPDDSPPSLSKQSMQQPLSSKSIPENRYNRPRTYMRTPTMQASNTERLTSLTTETTESTCNENSFNSTLTEGVLDASFDDKCSTPVPNQSQICGQLRRALSNESSGSEHSTAPPRKKSKIILDVRNSKSQSASVHREEEVSIEAVLLTNTIKPGENSCVKVLAHKERF